MSASLAQVVQQDAVRFASPLAMSPHGIQRSLFAHITAATALFAVAAKYAMEVAVGTSVTLTMMVPRSGIDIAKNAMIAR
ncbi:hypothetical protein AKI39_07025 [Bordetella sp. H567]|uniref:hypothetical protein n=1 Tax=Bordetella sp. H567 TaxID=1697043 RepID=UPI00081CCB6F|nr:hypothetical protein [Bordetella sp. H567]AOB30500.1 hypothetical protein AKI39_07025 [Bordetella sp. H567]